MGTIVNNNSGVVNTGSHASINNTVISSAPAAQLDWAALQKELEQLKEITDLKSLHNIADEASATVPEKNYPQLVSALKKMGEVGLDILKTTSLVIVPEIIRRALGLGG